MRNQPVQLKLEAPWPEVREKLKEVNPDLTDEDLQWDGEDASELLNHLAKKMQRSAVEIKGWIESVSFNKVKAS